MRLLSFGAGWIARWRLRRDLSAGCRRAAIIGQRRFLGPQASAVKETTAATRPFHSVTSSAASTAAHVLESGDVLSTEAHRLTRRAHHERACCAHVPRTPTPRS